MKTWKSSLTLKLVAVLVFAVCAATFGLSCLGVVYGYQTGIYTGQTHSFYETDECRSIANSMAYNNILLPVLYENITAEELQSWYGDPHENVDYALYQAEGETWKTLLDTRLKDEPYAYEESFTHIEGDQKYSVTVAIRAELPEHAGLLYFQKWLYDTVSHLQRELLVSLTASAVLGLATFVLLCCMAGHRRSREGITLNWMDRLPLDLYAAAVAVAVIILLSLSIETGFYYPDLFANVLGCVGLLTACLIVLALVLSFVTRVKVGKWWQNTVICRLLLWFRRNGLRLGKLMIRVFRAIPMVWRTLLTTGLLLVILLLLGVSSAFGGDASLLLYFLLSLGILAMVCYGVVQLQKLKSGGELLAQGNFDTKIDTSHMYWDFKRHGEHLNSVGDGMAIAVEQKLKSERLKTELITNVSHDIKTPLTSIINYVDLLTKSDNEEERQQYLEVLRRQSARLKKLTEDLVEASKASTGNVAAHLVPTNVQEAVNQALGEYQERLEAGKLTVVSTFPPEPLSVLADGRLLWRILDNLLSNACKYALAGTRVYVDASDSPEGVRISVKNISRQQLNVSADELMERFVRGDTARSTEGSGLGLNIARSLAELQRGKFNLMVDGDLFKAELILPRASL